jgi:hypothetical protein
VKVGSQQKAIRRIISSQTTIWRDVCRFEHFSNVTVRNAAPTPIRVKQGIPKVRLTLPLHYRTNDAPTRILNIHGIEGRVLRLYFAGDKHVDPSSAWH